MLHSVRAQSSVQVQMALMQVHCSGTWLLILVSYSCYKATHIFFDKFTYITLQRAQALYDVNIAILQLSVPSGSTDPSAPPIKDLTYEAYTYCSVLGNYLNGKTCWTGDAYLNDVKTNAAGREATSVVYVNETDINGGIFFFKGMAVVFRSPSDFILVVQSLTIL